MEQHITIEEEIENWQGHRERIVELLILELDSLNGNMTELASRTGIKRTTLYYMIYGREGKHGVDGKRGEDPTA